MAWAKPQKFCGLWICGLTRDTTHSCYLGVGDLDGDGKLEFITAQKDGKLICYAADPRAEKCPMCPANEPFAKLTIPRGSAGPFP
ncbi:MAG: hypothetical protein DME26_03275 [Verrucomicrobia bacterium]|nr:MAG: hypothetical protein DME26_03275 [Verrucomicrobiota bacterium]